MERMRRPARRICVLPLRWSAIVAAAGFGLLWWVLTHESPPALDFFAYHLSTYALVVSVTAVMRVGRGIRERLQGVSWLQRLLESPLAFVIRKDPSFRNMLTLALSMAWNVLWALMKLLAGLLLNSEWLKSLGVYYLALAGLKLIVMAPVLRIGRDETACWRRYRSCGAALMLMNLVLLRVVIQIVTERGSFRYPGPLIYLMAAYAFWAISNATVQLIAWHRRSDPLMSASRAVSLTAAMVSVLALETALINRFGDDPAYHRFMTAITGGAVCLGELGIAVYMLRRGKRVLAEMPVGQK